MAIKERRQETAGDMTPGQSPARQARSQSWANDIVQLAILEASLIRREAAQAGQRVYDALVTAAQERAEQILADAYQEAQRMVADAQRQAHGARARRSQEAGVSAAAMEAPMAEVAPGPYPPDADPLEEEIAAEPPEFSSPAPDLPPEPPDTALGMPPTESQTEDGQAPASPGRPEPDDGQIWQHAPDDPPPRDRRWVLPEWMSGEE